MTEKIQGGRPGDSMRWAFLEGLDIGADGDPYLDRLRIVQTPWFGIYLHHIHRPDIDRDPHDHPWAFASVILAGYYRERAWPDKRKPGESVLRHRMRWSLGRTSRRAAHIIERIDGPLWTLVLTGPRRAEWGFWREGTFVPWRDYISESSPETRTASPLDGGPGEQTRKLIREIVSSGPPEGLTVKVIQETMAMHGMSVTSEETIARWLVFDRNRGLVESDDPQQGAPWRPTRKLMTLLEGSAP